MTDRPALSVVVVIVSDTMRARASSAHLADCLRALEDQRDAPPLDIVVPYHPSTDGIEALRAAFPHVHFERVDDPAIAARTPGSREHHDVLRAHGLALARGDIVALLEDHARADPAWAASLIAAHRSDAAAVGGAIDNDIDRALNWAVFFCDFGKYQNPVPAGPSPFASDANVAYKRAALDAVRTLWQGSFHEVIVNQGLLRAGATIVLDPSAVVRQHRSALALGDALRERFVWGRSYAVSRNALLKPGQRMLYAALTPALPLVLTLRMASLARQRRRRFGKFLVAAPLALLLTMSWSAGECAGYLAGSRAAPEP